MTYKSKKDGWLILTFCIAVALPVASGAFLINAADARLAGWLLIGIGLAMGVLLYWLVNPLYYEITPSELYLRAGPLRWNIPHGTISEVCPTRSALGSPALSLDRLMIRYENGQGPNEVMISPKNQKAFLQDLAAASELQVEGNTLKRLVRKGVSM